MTKYQNMNSAADISKAELLKEYEEIEVAVSMVTLETVYQTSNPFFRNPTPKQWEKRLKEVDKEFKQQYRTPDRAIWNTPLIQDNDKKQFSKESLHLFFDENCKIWQNPPHAVEKTNNEDYSQQLPHDQINDACDYQIPQEQVADYNSLLPEENINGPYTQPMPEECIAGAYNYPLPEGQINEAYYVPQQQSYVNYSEQPQLTAINQSQPVFYDYNDHTQVLAPQFYYYELPPGQQFYPLQCQNQHVQSSPCNYPYEINYSRNTNTTQPSAVIQDFHLNNLGLQKSKNDFKSLVPTSSKRSDWTKDKAKTNKIDYKNNNKQIGKKIQSNAPIITLTNVKKLKDMFKEIEHPKKLPQKNVNKSVITNKYQCKTASENSKKGTEITNKNNSKLSQDIQQPKNQFEKIVNKGVLNLKTPLTSGQFPIKTINEPTNGKQSKSGKGTNENTNVKHQKSGKDNNKTKGKKNNNQKAKQKKK